MSEELSRSRRGNEADASIGRKIRLRTSAAANRSLSEGV
jgi:hypothetical protein